MTTALAIAAIVVSLAAIGISVWTAVINGRAATAAEGSEIAAHRAADAAKDSAESAAAVARAEVSRDHNHLEPLLNGRFGFDKNTVSPHLKTLVYRFRLDRRYDVRASLMNQTAGSMEAVVVAPERVDGEWRVIVEEWSKGGDRKQSAWSLLAIEFWPPAPMYGRARPWSCACGRAGLAGEGVAHWEWEVPVKPPRPPVVVVR
jgi:hypothetical protein